MARMPLTFQEVSFMRRKWLGMGEWTNAESKIGLQIWEQQEFLAARRKMEPPFGGSTTFNVILRNLVG
jgi:hypothetical protein